MEQTKILLGTGVLTWFPMERRTGRYGSVFLDNKNSHEEIVETVIAPVTNREKLSELVGLEGDLFVKILTTRESSHVGDWSKEIYPTTPEVSQVFRLGSGSLFTYEDWGQLSIGVKPQDGRKVDWLDPHQLYKVHEQTVELYFIPSDSETKIIVKDVEPGCTSGDYTIIAREGNGQISYNF